MERFVAGPCNSLRFIKGKVLNPVVGSHGYLVVNLGKNGKSNTFCVHKLVLLTFKGPCPIGKQSCHRNDNRLDNRASNLYWGTPKQNNEDAFRNGRRLNAYKNHPKGERNHNAKLTENQVRKIWKGCQSGELGIKKQLALEFGVSQSLISRISKRKSWRHLQLEKKGGRYADATA